jgi:hypothetical protein
MKLSGFGYKTAWFAVRIADTAALATPERLVRAYAYSGERGETSANFGPLTPQELSLGPRLYDQHSPAGQDVEDLHFPDEDDVMRLAGLWSVDPTSLEHREVADATGLRARYPRHGSPGRPREDRPWWQFWRKPLSS